jgi:hypothetical protein
MMIFGKITFYGIILFSISSWLNWKVSKMLKNSLESVGEAYLANIFGVLRIYFLIKNWGVKK